MLFFSYQYFDSMYFIWYFTELTLFLYQGPIDPNEDVCFCYYDQIVHVNGTSCNIDIFDLNNSLLDICITTIYRQSTRQHLLNYRDFNTCKLHGFVFSIGILSPAYKMLQQRMHTHTETLTPTTTSQTKILCQF